MADLTYNEELLQAMVRHQVGLLQYSGGVRNQIWALLDATEADLRIAINERLRGVAGLPMTPGRRERVEKLITALHETRIDAWNDVTDTWMKEMKSLALAEPQFTAGLMQNTFPVDLALALPDPQVLKALVTNEPFLGETMKGWAQKLEQSDLDRIGQQVRIGMAQGEAPREIARRVVGSVELRGADGVTAITRRQAESITRTATNSYANSARGEFFEANKDLISSLLFTATLDGRTTPICRALDGRQFKPDEAPKLPLHWGERSVLSPVIDGEVIGERPVRNYTQQQLVREFAEKKGITVKLPRGQTAKAARDVIPRGMKGEFDEFARKRMRELTGTAPAKLSYNDWLKGQSAQFQDDLLGPTRAKLFREGNLTLDKFVLADGSELTLAELAKREGVAFKSAGLDPVRFAPPTKPGGGGALYSSALPDESAWGALQRLRQIEIDDALESIKEWENLLPVDPKKAKAKILEKKKLIQKIQRGDLDADLVQLNGLDPAVLSKTPPPPPPSPAPPPPVVKPPPAPAPSKAKAPAKKAASSQPAAPKSTADTAKMSGDQVVDHIQQQFAAELDDVEQLAQEVERRAQAYNRAMKTSGGVKTPAVREALASYESANKVLLEQVMDLRPKIHELLKVDDGIAIKIRGQAGVKVTDLPAGMTDKLKEAERFLSSVTSKKMDKEFFSKPLTVKVRTYGDAAKKHRAYAILEHKEIHLWAHNDAKTIVHEISHILEAGGYPPGRRPVKAVQAFLKDRLAKDPKGIRQLSKITGKGHYLAEEVAFEDKFMNPYIGKIYGDLDTVIDGSEVVSMGVESMFLNPVKFMRRDPEMFRFIVNLLRGTY